MNKIYQKTRKRVFFCIFCLGPAKMKGEYHFAKVGKSCVCLHFGCSNGTFFNKSTVSDARNYSGIVLSYKNYLLLFLNLCKICCFFHQKYQFLEFFVVFVNCCSIKGVIEGNFPAKPLHYRSETHGTVESV